jgi:predicted DNA-binding transcriptional regulator YafY
VGGAVTFLAQDDELLPGRYIGSISSAVDVDAQALEPPELVERLRQNAERMLEFYSAASR